MQECLQAWIGRGRRPIRFRAEKGTSTKHISSGSIRRNPEAIHFAEDQYRHLP